MRGALLGLLTVLFANHVHAVPGSSGPRDGAWSLGIHYTKFQNEQKNMNDLIRAANVRENGITTQSMTSSDEGSLTIQYRWTGTPWAFVIRPGYLVQNSDGVGAGGPFNYRINAFTMFPTIKAYVLENESLHMFVQLGIGYGKVTGSIEENNTAQPTYGRATFKGESTGFNVGLGSEYCFTSMSCLSVIVDARKLDIQRTIVSDSEGSFDTAHGSLSQYGQHQQMEWENNDVGINLSGTSVTFGYVVKF